MFGNHRHKIFNPPVRGNCWTGWSIDDAVDYLLQDRIALVNAIKNLQIDNCQNKDAIIRLTKEIKSIHAHYRSELCGDCCHVDVCGIFPSVKYGFECEDKAYELEVVTFEVEPETSETESSKEETDAKD